MEHEKNVPCEGKEMNFFDLCAACVRAIGRGCVAFGRLLGRMTRLTWRYWWIVLTMVVLFIAAAFYYTRPDNLTFKVNAVALLNGPTIPQFEQAFAPLQSGQLLDENATITPFLLKGKVKAFETFRVVDCKDDGTADYVDFKHKSSPTDTLRVQMNDRLCLQFRIKLRYMALVPGIEQAVLDWLNGNEAMQQSYETYIKNLQEAVAFNHSQAIKLDSLTSCYYFNNPAIGMPDGFTGNNGVSFFGDRRIRLFLDDIYRQHDHLQQGDYRLQLATAPVTLENHFCVDPNPLNGRRKMIPLFLLLGWCVGCGIAELIDKRKVILAWLKQ